MFPSGSCFAMQRAGQSAVRFAQSGCCLFGRAARVLVRVVLQSPMLFAGPMLVYLFVCRVQLAFCTKASYGIPNNWLNFFIAPLLLQRLPLAGGRGFCGTSISGVQKVWRQYLS